MMADDYLTAITPRQALCLVYMHQKVYRPRVAHGVKLRGETMGPPPRVRSGRWPHAETHNATVARILAAPNMAAVGAIFVPLPLPVVRVLRTYSIPLALMGLQEGLWRGHRAPSQEEAEQSAWALSYLLRRGPDGEDMATGAITRALPTALSGLAPS